MKRFIIFLLLVVGATTAELSFAFEVNGARYEVIDSEAKYVTFYKWLGFYNDETEEYVFDIDEIEVPDEVEYGGETYKVKDIYAWAFYCVNVNTLTIGKNVVNINEDAFFVSDIKHIDVSLDNACFASFDGALYTAGWRKLRYYPKAKDDAIYTVASSTEEIMPKAFKDNPYLERVELPEGLRLIGDRAFDGAVNLSELNLPSTLEDVGFEVFDWRSPWYKALPDGPLYCGNHLLWHYKGTPEGGIIDVAEGCLSVATGFQFSGHADTLRLPKSVTRVNMQSGNNLMYFEVDPDNPVYSTFEGMLLSKDGSRMERFPGGRHGQFVVPEVRAIAPYAFAQSALSRVTLPKGVESIGDRAFYYCRDLSRIDLPATLTSIGEKAFEMPILSPMPTAPRKTRGNNSYYISDVYCRAVTPPATASNAFYGCDTSGATLHVPVGTAEAYRSAAPWNGFGTIVEIDFADVDGDGIVNGADMTALYGALLDDVAPAGIADVDGDGVVSGADITALYNRLLGQ